MNKVTAKSNVDTATILSNEKSEENHVVEGSKCGNSVASSTMLLSQAQLSNLNGSSSTSPQQASQKRSSSNIEGSRSSQESLTAIQSQGSFGVSVESSKEVLTEEPSATSVARPDSTKDDEPRSDIEEPLASSTMLNGHEKDVDHDGDVSVAAEVKADDSVDEARLSNVDNMVFRFSARDDSVVSFTVASSEPETEEDSRKTVVKKIHRSSSASEAQSIVINRQKSDTDLLASSPENKDGYLTPEGTRERPVSNGNFSDSGSSKVSSKQSSEKKKKSNWYSVLSPTYRSRSEEFKRIFKEKIPKDDRLIVEYSCALQKDILVQGRLYVTQNHICFYANIFRWETVLVIKCSEISQMTKEKTARVIPNAIQIMSNDEKYFFTSFSNRDKTHFMMFRVWQNALMDIKFQPEELWQWIHYSYGEELGLVSDDDDYVPPSQEFQQIVDLQVAENKSAISSPEVNLTDTSCMSGKEPTEDDGGGFLNGDVNGSVSLTTPGGPENISSTTDESYVLKEPPGGESKSQSLHVPQSLHINGNNSNIPTDLSDNTEDESINTESHCKSHEHKGFQVLDDVFYTTPEKIFELLFTDNKFLRDFVTSRKTFDMNYPAWPDHAEPDGSKLRTINYTLSLNYSIGPKSSIATEKQVLSSEYRPGEIYVIDCEITNAGIPYGENFCTVNKYCILKVSSNRTRVRINSQIVYKKGVWGLVKNFIDKTATQGVHDNFGALCSALHVECERINQGVPGQLKKKVLRRKRTQSHTTPAIKKIIDTNNVVQSTPVRGVVVDTENQVHLNATLVKIICAVLVLLVVFNLLLFYKLSSLEEKASSSMFNRRDPLEQFVGAPKSREDWVHLLKQQKSLHDSEQERWKENIDSFIQLLDHMKGTLIELRDTLGQRTLHPDTLHNTRDKTEL